MQTKEIWETFSATLHGFIKSKVKNRDDAKDILQEAFLRIHRSLPGLGDEQKLSPWVYAIARNLVNDYYRKRLPAGEMENEPEALDPEEDITLTKCMLPFVDQLPEKYRVAVKFSDIEGRSQKALAEKLGLSYTAAKSRVRRGRAMLRELFRSCCHIEADKYGNIVSHEPKGDCLCSK